MPIMKTETIRLHGVDFIRKIKWDGRASKFFVEVPDYISAIIDGVRLQGDTINEVIEKWNSAISKYDQASTEKRRVICYEYEGAVNVEPGRKEKGEVDQIDMDYDGSIGLKFWIGTEFKVGKEKSYVDDAGDRQSYHPNWGNEVLIDWTQEREDFLVDMLRAIETAHKKASKFFKQSKKKILSQMDSQAKLLTFGGGA